MILLPIIQPWYLLWLLPFFAVVGIRSDWQLEAVFTVFSSPSVPPTSLSGSSWTSSSRYVLSTIVSWGRAWICCWTRSPAGLVKEEWHIRPGAGSPCGDGTTTAGAS